MEVLVFMLGHKGWGELVHLMKEERGSQDGENSVNKVMEVRGNLNLGPSKQSSPEWRVDWKVHEGGNSTKQKYIEFPK